MAIKKVKTSRADEIQTVVSEGLRNRGLRDGWNDGEFATRTYWSAVARMAAMSIAFDTPIGPPGVGLAEALEFVSARTDEALHDWIGAWMRTSPNWEIPIDMVLDQIADAMIDLIVLADVLGGDIMAIVEQKARDIHKVDLEHVDKASL